MFASAARGFAGLGKTVKGGVSKLKGPKKPAAKQPTEAKPDAKQAKKDASDPDGPDVQKNGNGMGMNALLLGGLVGLPILGSLFGGGGGSVEQAGGQSGGGAAAAGSPGDIANTIAKEPKLMYGLSSASCVSSVSACCLVVLIAVM